MAESAQCPVGSDNQYGPRISLNCRAFDFTLLFEDVIFAALPAAILLLLLPARLQYLRKAPVKVDSYRLAVYKLTLLSALFILHALFLAFRLRTDILHTRAALPVGLINVLATFAAICASFMEDQRSTRPSDLLILYFSASTICALPLLRSLWLIPSTGTCRGLWTVVLVLTAAALLLESMRKTKSLKPMYHTITKEQLQGLWSRTFFVSTIPMFQLGFSKVLSNEDIPDVDEHLQGKIAGRKLRKAWTESGGRYRLIKAALRAYTWPYFSAFLPRLLLAGFTFAQPFLLTATLRFIQTPVAEESRHHGSALVGAYVVVYLGLALSTAVYWRQTYRFITMIRAGLVAMIYEQTVKLQSEDLDDSAAITLMGTDVERIVTYLKNIHEAWAAILEVAVAIYLLERQVWVVCVVPLFISLGAVLAMMPVSTRSGDAQKQWIERVQKRLAVTSSMLKDMKGVQMLGLNEVLYGVVSRLRQIEVDTSLRFRKLYIWQIALGNFPQDLAPFGTLAIYAAIAVIRSDDTILSAKAFTSLALISLLTNPLMVFCTAMPQLLQAGACFGRIEEYCLKKTGDLSCSTSPGSSKVTEEPVTRDVELEHMDASRTKSDPLITLNDASISKPNGTTDILQDINLTINPGVTMIIGPVGCGKSTLIETFLGQNVVRGEFVTSFYKAAYCAQTPWIQNTSIRQNIVCASEFDQKWYDFVIWACGLEADLESIPGGDACVTGSNGVAISGGQKQRIGFARAVYSKYSVLILDDVFSGLDSKNIRLISDRLFGQDGHFRVAQRSVILATNTYAALPLADDIILLENGRIIAQGPYNQILSHAPEIAGQVHKYSEKNLSVAEDTLSSNSAREQERPEAEITTPETNPESELFRQKGSWSVYIYYFKSAGYGLLSMSTFFMAAECFLLSFTPIWVQWWVEANERHPNQQLGLYVGVYGMLCGLVMITATIDCWVLFVKVLNNTSLNLHSELLKTALGAPIAALQKADTGTTINRFGQDLELIDMTLPICTQQFGSWTLICFVRLIILCAIGKYLAASVPIVLLILYILQSMYLRTSRQIRLLDIEAKAPLYTHFLETVSGISSIRAFKWEQHFKSQCRDFLNQSQKPVYMLFCIQQWLTLVLDLVVGSLAVILVSIVTSLKERFGAAEVGLALYLLLSFNQSLAHAIRMWTMMETSIGAVTRVQRFVKDTPKEEHEVSELVITPDWPMSGAVEFRDVVAGYSSDAPILTSITLSLHPTSKTLICGRSGSGKSSLLLALLQMLPTQSGHITIDSIPLSTVPRTALRSSLTVIPQDPFFMPGSLRENLDPLERANLSDEDVLQALEKVGLRDKVLEVGGLHAEFEVQAWSVGQRQLFALARALLGRRERGVLLLDEGMSSVDHETETLMHNVIETEFANYTVLAVAHRYRFLEWYDRVVVMKEGRIVEQGGAEELLGRDGEFKRLYDAGMRDH